VNLSAEPSVPFESVEHTLAGYNELIGEELLRWFPERNGGDVWSLALDYPSRPGKGLRPGLMLAACQAFGGSPIDALAPATSLELLHNAFLIHDDVEDASTHRRGRPTLHALHGSARAINAGDALGFVAQLPLRERAGLSARVHRRVLSEFEQMAQLTVEGQDRELEWRDTVDAAPTPEDYLDLILHKTCWYTTICPLRVGAIIGSGGRVPLAALSRFGFLLGAAFQIRDDLLNLVEWSDAYGKERLGDIREGKRTLMLIHLVDQVDGNDAAFLRGFLASPVAARDEPTLERVLAMMVDHGSIAFAEEYGRGIALSAVDAFDDSFAEVPDSAHRRFVRALIPYMLARRH